MKRSIVAALLSLMMIFSAVIGLVACDMGTIQGNQAKSLSAPTNVKVSGTALTWNPVENAVGYTVKIVAQANASRDDVGDEYLIESNAYSLEFLSDGEYTLFVKARGDSVVWSTSPYSAGINYTRNRDTGAAYEDDVVGAFGAFDEINTRESYLGYGVNIIDANGITSKNIKITYPIFKTEALLQEMLLKSNEHYSNLETIEAATIEEFKEKLSASSSISSGSSVSASANIYGVDVNGNVSLSTGLKSSFEHTSSETYSQYFLEIIAENQNYWLILQTEESRYREILSDEFKRDLYDTTITPAQLFDKYGTHLLTSVAMGGNITMFYTLYAYSDEVKDTHYFEVASSLKSSVDAVYGNYKAGVSTEDSFKNTFTYEEIANRYGIRVEKKIVTSGGSGSFGIINEQSLYNNYADWQKSLDAYPVVVGIKDSNSLYPIWNLIDTSVEGGAERYAELYSYFAEYGQDSYDSLCDTFGIKPPVAPTDIVNITAKNVYDYQDGEPVQVKPGDSFKITFDVLPDNANKYKKTFSVSKSEYVTVDESGNVEISENAPSRTEFTVTVRAGTVERDIKFYVVQSCTVKFNTGFAELAVPDVIVENSSLINEPEISREDFVLDGWYKKYTTDAGYELQFNFLTDRITENTILYAKWSAIEPVVTFDTVGGSEVEAQKLKYGSKAKEPADPYKDGHRFTGWYSNRSCTDSFDFTEPVKEDTILYAGWELVYYTVTFDTLGGVEISPKSTNINTDYRITEVIPTRAYYEFGGWYRDDTLTNKFYFDESIIEDITLYAKWTPVEVIVNLVDTDGSALKNELGQPMGSISTNIEKNFLLSDVSVPYKMGYTFIGWKYNGEKIDHLTREFIPKSNGEAYTIIAIWDAVDVIVNFTDIDGTTLVGENGDEIGAASTNVDYGFLLKNTVTPKKSGYIFKAWTYNGEEIDLATMKFDPKTNGEAYTLVAKWTLVDVTVKFVDTDGSALKNELGEEINAVSTNIEKGYLIFDVQTPFKTGYTFLGWKYNGGNVDLSAQIFAPKESGNAEYTLIAVWQINDYKLTYKINGDTVKEVTYNYNEKISPFTPDEKTGYTFSGWEGEPTVMPADNVTVIGSFSINSYTVTYILDGVQYGEIETLKYGETIILRAHPTDENKEDFSGWTCEGKQVPSNMPAANITITGTFGSEYYNVSYYVDGEIYATNRVCINHIIPTPEPEKTGYNFVGWSYENGDMISDITLMTAGDKTLKAVFELKEITVTVKYVYENGLEAQPSESETKKYGEAYGFTVTGIEGYSSDVTEISGTAGEESLEFTVTYTPNKYKLTVNYIDYDGTTKLGSETVDWVYGTYYTVEEKAFTGRCNPKVTDSANGIMPAKDHIVTVNYERKSVNVIVNFNASDGSVVTLSTITKSYKYAETYSITIPTQTGYETYLKGTNTKVTTVSGTVNTESSIIYNIELRPIMYSLTVKYVDYDGSTITTKTISNLKYKQYYYDKIDFTNRAGFTCSLENSTAGHLMPADNCSVTVKYTRNSYTVKVNYLKTDGTSISVSPITKSVLHLDSYGTYTIPTITGYSYIVYLNGSKVTVTNGQISGKINAADVTYEVKYSPNTYKITYDLNASSILVAPTLNYTENYKNVVYNTTFDLHTAKAQYYKFVGWYDAKTGGNRITDGNGNLISNVSGYTNSEGKWIKAASLTLYARWSKADTYSNYTYVSTSADVKNIANNTSAKYLIVKDIDMGGIEWTTISTFTGIIDGAGHCIYNFSINQSGTGSAYVGFIKNNEGTIANLTIGKSGVKIYDSKYSVKYTVSYKESSSESKVFVGGFAAYNNGTIENCHLVNTFITATLADNDNDKKAYLCLGGIVASNNNNLIQSCTVNNCLLDANATCAKENSGDDNYAWLGGIAAKNQGGTISECESNNNTMELEVRGDGRWTNEAYPHGWIGGIVGEQTSGSFVSSSCSVNSNTFSKYMSSGGYTHPTKYEGEKIGQKTGGTES